jgi:hypothetical protein
MGASTRTRKKEEVEKVLAAGAGGGHVSDHTEGDPEPKTQSQDEVELVRRGTEVLGIDHVAEWMRSPIPSLGNRTPYDLIQTEAGRKQIQTVLLKIEHGVY